MININDKINRTSKTGFTLIEVVVVIGLVAATSIVLANIFINQNRIYKSQNAELNVTSSVRNSLDDVDDSVRQANRALSSYSTYTAGPEVLILQLQSINAQNRLIAGTYDHVIYYLQNGNLMKTVVPDAASTRPAQTKGMGFNITNLLFTYNNADFAQVSEVSMTITASESSGKQVRSFTADSKAKLRNF